MKKRELYHKGIGLLVIVAFIIIALLVLDFGINTHIVTDSTSTKSSSIHKSELFSCYEKKLIVFSLHDSPLLRFASDQWNGSHTPEVVCITADDLWGQDNWNYNQVQQEMAAAIYQDCGPDLLVLDDLGYLDSRLLITNSPSLFQDISYICEQDSLYSNITHLYTNKEKTYAIPLRLIAPTVGGRDLEAVNSATTLNVLSDNVLKNESLNGIELYQKILAGLNIPRSEIVFNYAEALPELYYPIWRNYIKEDDVTSKDKYQSLVDILHGIVKCNSLAFQKSSSEVPSNNSPTNFMNSDSAVFCDFTTRSDNFVIPFYDFINNSHRSGYIDFISDPEDIKYCIPSTVVAIPANAKDSSKEFLLFLLSDNIQGEILGDGLPVNHLAFNKNITDASDTYNVSLSSNILAAISTLVPIADIDSLKKETDAFSEIFQSYCLGQITLEIAYDLYETAG